jgi:hypothetical protein
MFLLKYFLYKKIMNIIKNDNIKFKIKFKNDKKIFNLSDRKNMYINTIY